MSVIRKIPLLGWIGIAILLGILTGPIMPEWLGNTFLTYNSIFSGFLGFAVPLIILGLIMPAIAELGAGAGKWLGITAAIAYGCTIIAGFVALLVSLWVFTPALSGAGISALANGEGSGLAPYFTLVSSPGGSATEIVLPPLFDVMTALVIAFVMGIGLTTIRNSIVVSAAIEFRTIVELLIRNVIVPALPLFIFGIFMDLSRSGEAIRVISTFLIVVLVSFGLTLLVLLAQFTTAGVIAGKNPLKALWNMREAYVTALGTSSSAATIPITLRSTLKNGVSAPIAGFVVPLCATIHLSGSMVKIICFATAVMLLGGEAVSFGAMIPFILMLGVMMVAAPGVPGGAIAAASGLLVSMLGFGDVEIGLMFAMYIALDSFGTATNVTGDGAIAIIIDKLSKGKLTGSAEVVEEALA